MIVTIPEIIGKADRALRKRWFDLTNQLNGRAERDALCNVANEMLSADAIENLHGLLQIGGARLVKCSTFSTRPDDAVTKVVLREIRSGPGRALMKEISDIVRPWIRASTPETKGKLKEAFAALERRAGEPGYWAEVMRKEWKIKKTA